MSALWRKHPNKKGRFQAVDLGHAQWNSYGEMETDIWLNRRGSRKESSSAQKYAEGWDRIFGKERKA